MLITPLLLLLAQAAARPAVAPAPPATGAPTFQPRHGGRLFISPMGEPFHPNGREDDGLADWFRQADRDHDGRLTLAEMQQDAERFFALLDLNHDGEIDPDELTHYEEVVAPESRTGEHYDTALLEGSGRGEGGGGARAGGRGGHGGGGGHRHGGESGNKGFFRSTSTDQHQGAARYGLLDLPEPVIAADTDFNRGVSLSEFRAAAQTRFMALDLDHKGFLTVEGLESIRPAPPPSPNPPDNASQAPTAADFPPSPG